MVPDISSARQIRDELLLARIADGHIHVMAEDSVPLAGLREASILQKTDFVHGAGTGIGAWAASMAARSIPNSRLKNFEPTIPAFP
jgi:hypothetical protein